MRLALLLTLLPTLALADPRIDAALDTHVLPAFERLSKATHVLAETNDCAATDAWNFATEAWIAASHLRFGPTEADNRVFALAFWPDPRGGTPKALNALLAQEAPDLSTASIAGRGLYALEFLMYDPSFAGNPNRCTLMNALAQDASATADAILADWQDRYLALIRDAGQNTTYQSEDEAMQELYKALLTGLQFSSDTRLGRPLGSFDHPRPKRAEMRRSDRSLDNVIASLASLRDLAAILSEGAPKVQDALDVAFVRALERAAELSTQPGASDFAMVSDPVGRLKVEILQQDIDNIREVAVNNLGPALGVGAGFNALDGD